MKIVKTRLNKYKILTINNGWLSFCFGTDKDDCMYRFFRTDVYKRKSDLFLYYVKKQKTYIPYFTEDGSTFIEKGQTWKISKV